MTEPHQIDCQRCQTPMKLLGERWLAIWQGGFFNQSERVYVYICPSCAAMQFFDIDMLQQIYAQRPAAPPVQQ